jgi:hypothetical protein
MRHSSLAAVYGLVGGLALAGVASSQVEWNEMPLPEGTFREYTADYRTDVIEIPLGPLEELEYKLGLNEGDSIVYQWDAVNLDDPEMLYAEFHGHTEPVNNVGDLMYYRKATGASERGTLVAPFTGIHGWYLRNDTEESIIVQLQVAGFYELLPQ